MMPDRGDVRDGLRDLAEFLEAKRNIAGVGKGAELFGWWAFCVRETLREQEAVDAIRDGESCGKGDFGAWWYACGNCHGVIDYKDLFCRHCGRKVKWNDG